MTEMLRAEPPIATVNDRSGHLSITVMVNGRGPFRFIVDTGADRSVLADTTAAALGLRPQGAVMLAGIIRTIRTETVNVDSLAFGEHVRRDLTLPVLPRILLQADGYLGLDVLDGRRVILNFAANELTIADPVPILLSVYHDPGINVLPAQGSGGHLRTARCSVDHHLVAALVDTGAESSMGNEALYRALLAGNPDLARHSMIALTGLTGGTAIGRLIKPSQADIGRFTLTDCPIAIADLQVFDIWGLADRPALVIGMNWLRLFKRVSVDYGRKELRFELGAAGHPTLV
ncbi:aspartyl protease family protein [Rhizomicrobium electricum]|nr:aspartyl protease family protein [Rhizomicrobium electricum]